MILYADCHDPSDPLDHVDAGVGVDVLAGTGVLVTVGNTGCALAGICVAGSVRVVTGVDAVVDAGLSAFCFNEPEPTLSRLASAESVPKMER